MTKENLRKYVNSFEPPKARNCAKATGFSEDFIYKMMAGTRELSPRIIPYLIKHNKRKNNDTTKRKYKNRS